MEIGIIDEVSIPEEFAESNWVEKTGDFFATPGRLFFGREYKIEKVDDKWVLKNTESFFTFTSALVKIACIALLPLSLISTAFGLGLKSLTQNRISRDLPIQINARTEENFSGRLPKNPLSPNCVNSQQKSFWGETYNVAPIAIPSGLKDPLAALKQVLATKEIPFFKPSQAKLVEERENYLHYEYTVVIPSGIAKGTYIDDIDIFYDKERSCFDIRSASRIGLRDSLDVFNFKVPAANKKRVEAIRSAFLASSS